jgi:hypothetical protein
MLSGQELDHLTILLISRWELHNAPQPRVGSLMWNKCFIIVCTVLRYGWATYLWVVLGWKVPSTPNYLS